MGSSISPIGGKAGKEFGPLTGANFDTGVLLSTCQNVGPNALGVTPAAELPHGYKNVIVQLIPGDMTAGGCTVMVTFDLETARGNGDAWEPAPSPNTEASFAWTNPLTTVTGQRLLKIDYPIAAIKGVFSGDFDGTTTELRITAVP